MIVPSWLEGSSHYTLCPVAALHHYMDSTAWAHVSWPWVWPDSLETFSAGHVARIMCWVTDVADPGTIPHAHDLCTMGASLAFLLEHSPDGVQSAGHWSLVISFCTRYLCMEVRRCPERCHGIFPNVTTALGWWCSQAVIPISGPFLFLCWGGLILCTIFFVFHLYHMYVIHPNHHPCMVRVKCKYTPMYVINFTVFDVFCYVYFICVFVDLCLVYMLVCLITVALSNSVKCYACYL